jgi:diadenosine tetraphosphate (Ap4A) HIT family hydrolase
MHEASDVSSLQRDFMHISPYMKEALNSSSNCEPCNPPEQWKELDIKEYEHWRVGLHSNQVYLGRSVVVLKRHEEDFFDTTQEEQKEFLEIGKQMRDALREAFDPDLLNYSTLGNEVRHVHWHLVPRYERPVEFDGMIFEDKMRGKNWTPYDKGFLLPKKNLFDIRDQIKSALK